ncbi:12902_t:CDS:2 [Gigaspora margarita]|uniref:12902_t:CDS:1 n=1 Tax=Gigaspora margarita TaxID=4874 RepID=A0ABN7VRG3_GIGMA|nr:12902_t:CDS:2 [Gigaspora margarita]
MRMLCLNFFLAEWQLDTASVTTVANFSLPISSIKLEISDKRNSSMSSELNSFDIITGATNNAKIIVCRVENKEKKKIKTITKELLQDGNPKL